jgi:hypothetical protein
MFIRLQSFCPEFFKESDKELEVQVSGLLHVYGVESNSASEGRIKHTDSGVK